MEFDLKNMGLVVHQSASGVLSVASSGLLTPVIPKPSYTYPPLRSYNPPINSFPTQPAPAPIIPPPHIEHPIVLEPTHPIETPPVEAIPAATLNPPTPPLVDAQSAPTRPPQPAPTPSQETLAAVSQSMRASRTRPIGTIPPR